MTLHGRLGMSWIESVVQSNGNRKRSWTKAHTNQIMELVLGHILKTWLLQRIIPSIGIHTAIRLWQVHYECHGIECLTNTWREQSELRHNWPSLEKRPWGLCGCSNSCREDRYD